VKEQPIKLIHCLNNYTNFSPICYDFPRPGNTAPTFDQYHPPHVYVCSPSLFTDLLRLTFSAFRIFTAPESSGIPHGCINSQSKVKQAAPEPGYTGSCGAFATLTPEGATHAASHGLLNLNCAALITAVTNWLND
jgi:hypothetical protein